jgi:ribosomal protein S18 acetylase RimI-like enzyme
VTDLHRTAQRTRQRLRNLVSYSRTHGVAAGFRRLMSFIGVHVYSRFDGLVYQLEPLRVTYRPDRQFDYEIRELREAVDLSHLYSDLTRENVQRRILEGERCFVALHQGRVIGTAWWTARATRFEELAFRVMSRKTWLRLKEGEGYVYRCAVHPDFRGHKIVVALLNAIADEARVSGLTRLTMSSGTDNVAMRKQALRGGWTIREKVECWRILGIVFRRVIPAGDITTLDEHQRSTGHHRPT